MATRNGFARTIYRRNEHRVPYPVAIDRALCADGRRRRVTLTDYDAGTIKLGKLTLAGHVGHNFDSGDAYFYEDTDEPRLPDYGYREAVPAA